MLIQQVPDTNGKNKRVLEASKSIRFNQFIYGSLKRVSEDHYHLFLKGTF